MGTINSSMQAVQKAQIDLDEVDNLPPLGQDMVCVILNVPNIEKRSSSATVCTDIGCGLLLCMQASRVWIQNRMDESKHEIHSQVDAITAGTASVVNLTAGQ